MSEELENDLSGQESVPAGNNDASGWNFDTDKIADRIDADGEEPEQAPEEPEDGDSEISEEVEPEEHGEDTEEVEPEQRHTGGKDPIVLRKQKKQLTEKVRRLEGELERLRQPVIPQPVQPQGLIDPATGQPVEENSVTGQVLKVMHGLARQNQEAQQKAAVQQNYNELLQKLDATAEKYDDFDEVVRDEAVPITDVMRDIAMLLPNPGETLYRIAKNPSELQRIINLSPKEQAREMIKVSGEIMSRANAKRPAVPAKTMGTLRNNPVKRQKSSNEITESSSVAEIRERYKKGWR